MAVLAVAFVVSGVGNMLGHVDAGGLVAYSAWPTWLSPIGWGFEMRPFGGDRWWLLALSGVLAAVLIVAAGRYAARRDLGRGVLPGQTGRGRGLREACAGRSGWPGACSARPSSPGWSAWSASA